MTKRYVVIKESIEHNFKKGDIVTETGGFGFLTGLPLYENEEGLVQSMTHDELQFLEEEI